MARLAGPVGNALSSDHLVSHEHCCSDCCLSTSLQGREDAWFRSLGKSGTSHHKATFRAVSSCTAAARAAPPGQTSRGLRQIQKLWLFRQPKVCVRRSMLGTETDCKLHILYSFTHSIFIEHLLHTGPWNGHSAWHWEHEDERQGQVTLSPGEKEVNNNIWGDLETHMWDTQTRQMAWRRFAGQASTKLNRERQLGANQERNVGKGDQRGIDMTSHSEDEELL